MEKIESSGHIKGYFVSFSLIPLSMRRFPMCPCWRSSLSPLVNQVTVDAAAPGKREADERSRAEVEVASGISGGKIQSDAKGGGIGRSVGGFIDPSLNWGDLTWLRSRTKLPIAFKGIQTVEVSASRVPSSPSVWFWVRNWLSFRLFGACRTRKRRTILEPMPSTFRITERGLWMGKPCPCFLPDLFRADGWFTCVAFLSSRSPPALYTLLELNKFYPEVIKDKRCEVYLDGGVRRGTDVVKALCLGANGVGIGRPFMYALTMGEEGVIHGIEIIRDEIETTLRLLGVTKLSQLGPHLVSLLSSTAAVSTSGICWPAFFSTIAAQHPSHRPFAGREASLWTGWAVKIAPCLGERTFLSSTLPFSLRSDPDVMLLLPAETDHDRFLAFFVV
jgi:hypothetical protein